MKYYFWLLMVVLATVAIGLLPVLVPSDAYTDAVKLMGPP